MTKDEAVANFEATMSADAEQFEKMADALERLIPHFVGEEEKEQARIQVTFRREMAQSTRELIHIAKKHQLELELSMARTRNKHPLPAPTWTCPHCGQVHTPATLMRLDSERLQCQNCKRAFDSIGDGNKKTSEGHQCDR